MSYARARNVSKIVLGKPGRPRWREVLFGSVVNDMVRKSGDIDVYDDLQLPRRLEPFD